MEGGCGGGGVFKEVANDAVWGGVAEIVGKKGAPWDLGIDGFKNFVEGLLLVGVE